MIYRLLSREPRRNLVLHFNPVSVALSSLAAMAQSGRSRSDSGSRAGRNEVLIKVILLDGEEKSFSVNVSAKKHVDCLLLIVYCSEETLLKQ